MLTAEELHEALRRAVRDSQTVSPETPVGLLVDADPSPVSIFPEELAGYVPLVRDAVATASQEADYVNFEVSSSLSLYVVPIRIPKGKPSTPSAHAFAVGSPLPTTVDFIPFPLRNFASLATALMAVVYSENGRHSLVARAFQAGAPDLGLELICHYYNCDAAILWMYRPDERLFESYTVIGAPTGQYSLGLGMGIVGQLSPTRRMVEYRQPSGDYGPFHPELFKTENWSRCQGFAVCTQGSLLGAISLYWKAHNLSDFLPRDETSALGDLVYGFLAEEAAELTIIESEEKYEGLLARLAPAQALTVFLHDVQKALRDASTAMNAAAVLLASKQEGDRQVSQNLVSSATFIDACMNRMSRLALLHDRQHTTQKVDLQALLLANKALFEMYNGVKVSVRPGSLAVWVRGDRLAIERAVLNLLTNAIYWTEAKQRGERRVDVSLVAADGTAVIEVSDTGIGINPEIRERIFQKFVTGRADSGTGLGLHTVEVTMREHGGSVSVRDNSNHGATFRLNFPMLEHR